MSLLKINVRRLGQQALSQMIVKHPFGPCCWSSRQRLLHNLAANTFDQVSGGPQEGSPIIIMHGLFGSKQNWSSISKALNAQSTPTRKVIAVDARNHGASPHTSTHTYEEMAEDIQDFLKARQIEKVVIIGHSMGGRAMMTFAFKYPQMIEKSIIVDISPVRSSPLMQSMITIFASMLEVNVPSDLDMKTARSLADKQLQKNITDNETRGFVMMNFVKHPDGRYGWKANVETLQREFPEHISRFPSDLKASSCSVPTLFVAGTHSDYILPKDLPDIQKVFPNSSLVFLDTGHLVHMERPKELIQLILDFINTV